LKLHELLVNILALLANYFIAESLTIRFVISWVLLVVAIRRDFKTRKAKRKTNFLFVSTVCALNNYFSCFNLRSASRSNREEDTLYPWTEGYAG